MQQRQTAYKVWIADLLRNAYVRGLGEFDPNYVEIKPFQVGRVNLVGVVVDVFSNDEQLYASVDLDDGSGVLRLKAFRETWRMLQPLVIGDLILVVGKVKEYNDERYVLPEIVTLVEPGWAGVRKAELLKQFGEVVRFEQVRKPSSTISLPSEEILIETVTSGGADDRHKILELVEEKGEISLRTLADLTGLTELKIDQLVKDLLKEGEIYQSKPGFLKLV